MSAGILCEEQMRELVAGQNGRLRITNASGGSFDPECLGLSSLDLPLGRTYWEMKGSCRSGKRLKVTDITAQYAIDGGPKSLENEQPVTLKREHVYLFEVDCQLDFEDEHLQGKSTGRSSIGRLDVLVRLLVNGSNRFDRIEEGRHHKLYVEVTPISFDIIVRPGTTLSQLRLFRGDEALISLTGGELFHEEDDDFPVRSADGAPHRKPCTEDETYIWFPFSLDLSADPVSGCSGFVAKKKNDIPEPIDLSKPNGSYDPTSFWEPVYQDDDAVLLEPDRLYILRSAERLRIPPHLALECKSYTEDMGEWRIEYAGFAHPFFGRFRDNNRGTPIIFEVRGHNVRTLLREGIPLGNVCFRRMSRAADEPDKLPDYEEQELALSKYFAPWKP